MNSKNEQTNDFDNIKSDYFLRKLFDILKENKSLSIIKYNKKLQKRLNISIDNYKECSKIEIELKLADNEYGKFVNVTDKEKEYYHIYFDNSNEEIKRNYLEENEKVKKIKIIIDYQVKSLKGLFGWCHGIHSVFFKKFKRNNISNMSWMFYECWSLKEFNRNNFNTNNVTDMSLMFYNCSSLIELNLSNFNTNNVTNMSSMFSGCSSLKKLNLSNFNTNNVTDMRYMFNGCSKLRKENVITKDKKILNKFN